MYPLQMENGWYIEKFGDVEEKFSINTDFRWSACSAIIMTSWGPILVPIVVEDADLKVGSAKCEFRLRAHGIGCLHSLQSLRAPI
ncbi:hypothetical protein SCLCIDRAFT_1217157 [Scleroderma citrinum Foug A]|uniref:Uncharacterized protein n=1 Tax=Scleroderma citrinum Foug A TaxID=1036808 RepID=A0A0C3A5Z9_9AGAM|nr:hypothetical protein SCLCIDRAFT_1217157 [Scleroderma citrinum Foug A]